MKKKIAGLLFFFVFLSIKDAYALSVRHHIYNMGRELVKVVTSPVEGVLIEGPKRIKATYQYEVHGREQPEARGLPQNYLFAFWRAPGEEMKAVIDGVVGSVQAAGNFTKEFLSIFFSD